MLTVMVRCQAPTTKHMAILIARIEPRRERMIMSNHDSSAGSLGLGLVRRLYITLFLLLFIQPQSHPWLCLCNPMFYLVIALPTLPPFPGPPLARPSGMIRSKHTLHAPSLHVLCFGGPRSPSPFTC